MFCVVMSSATMEPEFSRGRMATRAGQILWPYLTPSFHLSPLSFILPLHVHTAASMRSAKQELNHIHAL